MGRTKPEPFVSGTIIQSQNIIKTPPDAPVEVSSSVGGCHYREKASRARQTAGAALRSPCEPISFSTFREVAGRIPTMDVIDHNAEHPRTDLMPLAAALENFMAHPEDLAVQAVHQELALRLLDGYLRSLTSLEEPPSAELAPIIGVYLLDLAAATLGATAKASEFLTKRGVKAARVQAVLAEIARNFSDPEFELDSVARDLGLSRRYVQQLLEETGKSFTEHLVEHRLERSFAMLNDHRCLHLMIIDIAFAVGFGDVSHFNRVFRRRFGDTPSRIRASAFAPERKRQDHLRGASTKLRALC
jgi:AraC-like DNA-binding protein